MNIDIPSNIVTDLVSIDINDNENEVLEDHMNILSYKVISADDNKIKKSQDVVVNMTTNMINLDPIIIEVYNPLNKDIMYTYTVDCRDVASTTNVTGGSTKPIDLSGIDKFDNIDDIKQVNKINNMDIGDPSGICIFAQDNFTTLRDKIYVITGIPIYRQHILYYLDDLPHLTYMITIGEDTISINMEKELMKDSTDKMLGIPITRILLNNVDDIEVLVYETNLTVKSKYGTMNKIRVIDLFSILDPSKIEVVNTLKNDYYKEVIYYGIIFKYYPQFTYESFLHIYINNQHMSTIHPNLHENFKVIQNRYKLESKLLNKCIKEYPKMKDKISKLTSRSPQFLTRIVANVLFPYINVRNLFDYLVLDDNFIYTCCRLSVGSMDFFVEKKHKILYNKNLNKPRIKTNSIILYTSNDVAIYIYRNNCSVEVNIPEEERRDYSYAVAKVAEVISPIISLLRVNELALIMDGQVPTELKITIFSSDIILTYSETVNSQVFKGIYSYLQQYDTAGIIEQRASKPGEHTILMMKGTTLKVPDTEYFVDIRNQFVYYTNSEYKSRLNSYTYKYINISHRASDVAIYLTNFSYEEVNNIADMLMTILYMYLSSSSNKTSVIDSNKIQKVKRLQEIDPELFNFKKTNEDATVYSVRCQSERQPFVYREEEISSLSNDVKSKLIKFVNFTDGTNVYYHCPNRKFPVMTFKPQIHPMKYCVPCCKKIQPSTDSLIDKIDAICIKKFKLDDEDLKEVMKYAKETTHVLSYGKSIPPSRYSYVHPIIYKWCNKYKVEYRLYGVEQSSANADDAYCINAFATALNINVPTLIRNLLKNLDKKYSMIDSREIDRFESIDSFKNTMISIFVEGNTILDLSIEWAPIIEQLSWLTYGIHVLRLEDINGRFRINSSKRVISYIKHYSTDKILVLLTHDNGTYPMSKYIPERNTNTFLLGDKEPLIENIKQLIKDDRRRDILSLDQVLDFIKKDTNYKLDNICMGKRGMIYAVILEHTKNGKVYVPILYTEYIVEGQTLTTDLVKYKGFSINTIVTFVLDFNKVMKMSLSINYGLTYKGDIIALAYIHPGGHKKFSNIFYHEPIKVATFKSNTISLPKLIEVQYDCIDINKAILGKISTTYGNVDIYLYNNFVYRLFLKEFIYVVRQNSDKETRSALMALSSKIKINRKQLYQLLHKYPRDYRYIIEMIQKVGSSFIVGVLRSTTFDFDRTLMAKLRDMNRIDRIKEISSIMLDRVIFKEGNISMSNVHVSCSVKSEFNQPQCKDNKLLMRRGDFDNCVNILADDLELVHRYNMISVNTMGIVNTLNFTRRPHEQLLIEHEI